MDVEQAAAQAAAAGVGFLTLGDRMFAVRPMSGPDEYAVYQEMRRQVMSTAGDPLDVVNKRVAAAEKAGKPYSPTMVEAMVKAALSAASRQEGKAEPTEQEIAARINSLDGARWLIWFRLRRSDPDVTQAWVREAVPDEATKDEVLVRFAEIAGLKDLDPKKA